jgi:hypothetical protein
LKKLLFTVLVFSGCAKGQINVSAIEGSIADVTARHDQYVTADTTLTADAKANYLRSSALLNAIVAEAKK